MSELRIAGNSIPLSGVPSGAGHMQIVYIDNAGNSFEIEVQRPDNFFFGSWDIRPTNRQHDDIGNTPYYTDGSNNANYRSVLLSVDAQADAMWNILSQAANQFLQASFTNPFQYDVDYNSNTYVNTLISILGINIFQPGVVNGQSILAAITNGNQTVGYPGASRNALFDMEYPNDAINLSLVGTAQNDTIITGFGQDTIIASAGSDFINGSGDADPIFPRLDYDTVDYSQAGFSIVTTTGSDGATVNKGNGNVDTLIDIENIIGTTLSDQFILNSLSNSINIIGNSPVPNVPLAEPLGKDGNPLESPDGGRNLSAAAALAASDQLHMLTGDEDTISVSQALFDAGAQVTYLTAQGEGVIWLEQNGVTQMITYTGIFNEEQQTEFFGGLPNGTVTGLNDTGGVVLDFSGSDTAIDAGVLGGIALFNLVDELIGSDLGDTIDLVLTGLDDFFGGSGDDTVFGGGADNVLSGGEGDNALFGEGGDDTLIGGTGADSFDGGTGIDTVDYSSSDSGVWADLQGLVSNMGDAVGDIFVDVENLVGTDFVDRLYGDASDNAIDGGAGNDALFGRNGNDSINGGLGNDFLIGGSGNDMLLGGEGNDQIQGNLGDDIINGGGGNDVLTGGAGADAFDGGAGIDRVQYTSGTNFIGVTAALFDASINTNDAAGDSYVGIENLYGSFWEDNLYGDSQDNRLDGRGGDDMLFGREGDDFLVGSVGDDFLAGGTGDDKLNGGVGSDTYSFGENAGTDFVLNYEDGVDSFEFTFGVFSFADLTLTQQGNTAIIESASGTIRVSNTDISVFDASDFIFNSPAAQEPLENSVSAYEEQDVQDVLMQTAFYDIDAIEFSALI